VSAGQFKYFHQWDIRWPIGKEVGVASEVGGWGQSGVESRSRCLFLSAIARAKVNALPRDFCLSNWGRPHT